MSEPRLGIRVTLWRPGSEAASATWVWHQPVDDIYDVNGKRINIEDAAGKLLASVVETSVRCREELNEWLESDRP